jgi:hypothetical protein
MSENERRSLADLGKVDHLSEDQKKKINDWFLRIPGGLRCEICKNINWTVYETFTAPLVVSKDIVVNLSPLKVYPQFVVCCTTCGNTKSINAIVAGVLPGGGPAT